MIQYWGTSPKLGSCQGECPYPCDHVLFFLSGPATMIQVLVDLRVCKVISHIALSFRILRRHIARDLKHKQLETQPEDICVIRWSKTPGVYIMNFYRPKYVTCKKTESGRHTRCPRDRGARPVGGAPSTLVGASCHFRTTSSFLKVLNIPKLIKIAIGVVLESVYLPYHVPMPFRSLEHSGKCLLCIP